MPRAFSDKEALLQQLFNNSDVESIHIDREGISVVIMQSKEDGSSLARILTLDFFDDAKANPPHLLGSDEKLNKLKMDELFYSVLEKVISQT